MNPFDQWNNMHDVVDVGNWLHQQQLANSAPPASPQQPKKKKNFLVDQISTLGGIAGGIGGSFLAPIAGTVAGGTAGSALGQAIENAITGDSIGNDVAKEGALGGLFALPPIKAGRALLGAKVTAGAAKALPAGVKAVEGEVIQKAAEEPLRTSAAGRLTELGNKALASQYGTIGKPTARATNPLETIGQLADIGITRPEDAERIARSVTGSQGLVNKAVLSAVGKSGKVPTDNLMQIVDDGLQNNGVVEGNAKSVRSVAQAQIRKLLGGPKGTLATGSDPNTTLEVMKSLEKRIADLSGRGGNYRLTSPERADQANVLQLLHDELQDRLYTTAGANANLSKVLTPELRDKLVSLHPTNPKWQSYVDNNIMQSKDVGELRSTMAPFVRIGKIIDEADTNNMTFGGRAGDLANSAQGGLVGLLTHIGSSVAKSPAARAAGTTLRNVGNGNISMLGAGAPSRLGIGARVGAAGLGSGVMNQAQELASAQTPESPSLEDALMSYSQPQTPTSPYSRENLMADVQRDPRNADKYFGLYSAYQDVFAPPKTGKLSAGQQETAIRAQNALGDLAVINDAINNGSLLKTAIPGSKNAFVGNALGTSDIEAALFNIGDVILRSRTGAQAPESEIKAFVQGFLPRAGESKETQQYKLQRAYRELQGMATPTGSLEDAIMSANN